MASTVEAHDRGLRKRLMDLVPEGRSVPEAHWRSRHRAILGLLWAHVGFLPLYAVVRGFPVLHGLWEAGIVAAPAIVASVPGPSRRVRAVAASFGLLSCSAVLVHLSGGLIEMHFHFFVMVAVVALYQDWLPFLTAIAYVFVHHGFIGVIDPKSVYNHPEAWAHPWTWAGIHAGFIFAISAACLVTWRLNEQVLDQQRRAEDRLTLLAEVSTALTQSLDLNEIVRAATAKVAPAIADYCVVDLVGDDRTLRRIAVAYDPRSSRLGEMIRGFPPNLDQERHPVVQVITSGEPAIISDMPPSQVEGAIEDQEYRSILLASRPKDVIVAPLRGRGGVLGALSVGTVASSGKNFGVAEAPLIDEIARRFAAAIENAQLYARQRTVAETLQHSLLPERLPDVPGIQCAARYVPGGPGVEVGGDWYDVVHLSSGAIAIAMGDVVGRGERAASLMGQLRNAARALGAEFRSPAVVLSKLNRLLLELGKDDIATMIYAIVDLEAGTLRYVSAGHPPPLVIAADGSAEYIETVSGAPLGALPRSRYIENITTLSPGATVMLYTDGLVEDRAQPIAEGLARLRDVASGAGRDIDALCDEVLEACTARATAKDDVAILAVRLMALEDTLTLRLQRDPNVLASLRTTMRRWLTTHGVGEQEIYEILVAAGEASANAIRHAGMNAGTHFVFEARIGEEVEISVRDGGTWRPPSGGDGRGIAIMEALMDHVEIIPGPGGTTTTLRKRLGSTVRETI